MTEEELVIRNHIKERIADFKRRRKKLIEPTSAYAMDMTIQTLNEIMNFIDKKAELVSLKGHEAIIRNHRF